MRSGRYVLLVAMLGTSAAIGVTAYLMFWGPDRLQFSGKSLPELIQGGELLALVALPVIITISGFVMIKFWRIFFPSDIPNGCTAPARVLKVWDTGVSVNDNPQVSLVLEVTPAGGSPFQVETRTIVSRLSAGFVVAGIGAEVKFDPQNHQRLRVLSLETQGAAAAGITARLEELERLRDRRLIDEDEYRQKRAEILKTL